MGVSYAMIQYRIYQLCVLICSAAAYGIRQSENEESVANYYRDLDKKIFEGSWSKEWSTKSKTEVSELPWGGTDYGTSQPQSGEISIECRSMPVTKGPSTIQVAQGSWIAQAFKYNQGREGMNENREHIGEEFEPGNFTDYRYDPTSQWYHIEDSHQYDPPKHYFSGVNFTSNHHVAMFAVYYWANVVTSTSATVLIPMKNTFSQSWEILMQIIGLYFMVYICVEFKNVGEVLDRARQKATLQYYQLNNFFKNTEEVRSGSKIHKLIQRQLVLNYQKKSHHLEKQIFSGLPSACAKDLAAERYGEILQMVLIQETDPHRKMLRTRDIAFHVYKMAVVGGTQVLKNRQITNDIYFIADGAFVSEIDNSDRYHSGEEPDIFHRIDLPKGTMIFPDGMADSQITAVTDGIIYVISREAFYNHMKLWGAKPLNPGIHLPYIQPQSVNIQTRSVEKCKLKNFNNIENMKFAKCESLKFVIPPWFGLLGIIMATLNWIQGDVTVLDYTDLIVGVAMILYILYNKISRSEYLNYNTEELLSVLACLPFPFQYRWSVRLLFFYLEAHYFYTRACYDLGVKLYAYRIIRYATWMISICASTAGAIKLIICGSGNDCEWNSILLDARDQNGFLMDKLIDESTNETVWQYPKDTIERPEVPFYTFTNLFYAVFDSFTSTGFGNLRPRKAEVMFIFTIICVAGRVFVAALLGLGGDVLEQELHTIHSDYLSLRNRIKHYLRKAGCNDTRVGYICNFIDSDYRKTMHFDIRDTLAGTCIAPGLRRDFFYELFGETIKSVKFFSDCSHNCISEIADRAASIEYYYAGNIVQEADTPFLGMIIIMKGSVVVDDNEVKVKGDTVFEEIIDRQVPAHRQVKAFSECQIVRLDWAITRAILQLYKKDKAIVHNKIRAFSHSYG